MKNDYSSRIYSLGQWKVLEELIPTDLLEEYKQAFQILDRKNVGKISIRDLSIVTCSIGVQLSEDELRLYVDDVITGMRRISMVTSCDPLINFTSFLKLMAVILTEWISVEEVMLIFNEFDSDGDGFISPKELRNLLNKHQTPLTDQQLEDMMKEADRDGDGMVSLREFVAVMSTSTVMADRILNNMDKKNGQNKIEIKGNTGKQKIEQRRKSLADWIKQNSFKKEDEEANQNNNSNNNNDCDVTNVKKMSRKQRKSSLGRKFTITMNMLKKQVSRTKIRESY